MAIRALVQTAIMVAVLGGLLFGAAGDWRWPQVWVFLAEVSVSWLMICAWLCRYDKALLKSRLGRPFHRDQKGWDRLFLVGVLIGFVGWMVLIALDGRRFGWSHVPLWAEVLGAWLIAICMALVWWVFRVNSFAAPQVRIQAERGQRVVTEGPYRIVRHPMYAAALFYFLGVPLLLGSWWGLLPVPVFIVGLGMRTVGEERMLLKALPGYGDYFRRVRFRLVPGIW